MRGSLLALLLVAALATPAGSAHADDPANFCEGVAAEQALPILAQSYQFTPNGYGNAGFAPLIGGFGAGPAGAAALTGPPGPTAVGYGPAGSLSPLGPPPIIASAGPLGPGLTSAALRPIVLPPNGAAAPGPAPGANTIPIGPPGLPGRPQIDLNGVVIPPPSTTGTQIQLGFLQQAELSQLATRLTNSANYQVASAFWAMAYASQALETYNEVLSNCKDALIGPGGPLGALGGALGNAGGPAGAAEAAAAAPTGGSTPPANTPAGSSTPTPGTPTGSPTPTPTVPGAGSRP
jgi:hypothetical protein